MTCRVVETRDIDTCLAIRKAVFVDEQGIDLAEDLDGLDDTALHVLAMVGEKAIGTARILADGETAKIGRVAVLKEARGHGYGRAIMDAVLDVARANGFTTAKLAANTTATAFYVDLGFEAYGEEFLDAGLPHIMMTRTL